MRMANFDLLLYFLGFQTSYSFLNSIKYLLHNLIRIAGIIRIACIIRGRSFLSVNTVICYTIHTKSINLTHYNFFNRFRNQLGMGINWCESYLYATESNYSSALWSLLQLESNEKQNNVAQKNIHDKWLQITMRHTKSKLKIKN